MNTIKKTLLIITAILCAFQAFAENADGARFVDRFEMLPLFEFEQDIRLFSAHKNDLFYELFFLGAKSDFNVHVVSFDEYLYFGMRYTTELLAGQQDRVMAFDPREANYAIVPYFFADINAMRYEIGLDHSCFHRIDREGDVPYWNRVYAKTSSAPARFPIEWSAEVGYFITTIFGMNPLIWGNNHPWDYSMSAFLRYTFYENDWLTLGERNEIIMFADANGKAYYTGKFGIDADFRKDKYTFGLFITYNHDFPRVMPLLSRDRLLEWGMRFRF